MVCNRILSTLSRFLPANSYGRILRSRNSYGLRFLFAEATKVRSRPIKPSCVGISCFFSIKWSMPLSISIRIFIVDALPIFAEDACSFVYYSLSSSFSGPILVDPPKHTLFFHSLLVQIFSFTHYDHRNSFRSLAKLFNSSRYSSPIRATLQKLLHYFL